MLYGNILSGCVCMRQLTEINGDLLEEHNASSNAMDMLEKEMTERQRLDRELREIQVNAQR